jgi:hypothetical protein
MLAQGAAAVADSAASGQCQGPVCALLPVLSAMNLTLSDVQVSLHDFFLSFFFRLGAV